jgi:hypothetical protein
MKNLFKKIRGFKLIKETKGYLAVGSAVFFFFMFSFSVLAEVSSHLQPHVYYPNESTSSPTIADEESEAVGVVIVINGVPTFGKFSSKSPDPTPANKLTEEIVLPEEEGWGKNQSAEEIFGEDSVEYVNAISDENKENQSKESASNKISDDKTKKQLAQNQLPDDKLSIDIYNSIENIVTENIKDNQMVGDIGNISAELVKDIFSKKAGTSNSEENVVNDIKENLRQKKLLAEKEIVEKRRYLKLCQQYKEEYEDRVAVIDRLGADSVWAQNLMDYKNDKKIIDEFNRKIADAEEFIKNYETEIASETSVTVESNESVSENTADATQPTTTTPDTALPPELTLIGNVTGTMYGDIYPLTLKINFVTQVVSGTFSFSGPTTIVIGMIDENGNTIEKKVIAEQVLNGTISGKIDLSNYIIKGDCSESSTSYYEGKTYSNSNTVTVLGSLDENNQASGTFDNGYIWEAK